MRIVFTLLMVSLVWPVFGQSIREEAVSARLLERVQQAPEATHHFFILLKDRVDIQSINLELRTRKAGLAQRAQEVIPALQAKAEATQAPLIQLLEAHPGVLPGSIRSFWITNLIGVQANASVIAELSRHPDVAMLDWNAPLALSAFERTAPAALSAVPGGIEPGLAAIKAPALWAMGYTGYGRVAFTNDTGIDPYHPALGAQFRGFYASAEASWYEYDGSVSFPYDCDNHGSHVTGTILGLDRQTSDTIGVAFNAQWIGCSTIGCGSENFNLDNIGALQWAADPDGNPATVDDMPDVVNNSWYDPNIDDDCTSVYVDVLTALDALGVAVVFSAGNEGPGTQTISSPHNINVDLVNSFTVGAVNGNNSTLPIANFSSRGPSNCGGEGSLLIKPEVSAPGVSVRSSVPGDGYAFFNGTSMAAPHVSGAVLLLKEAFPYLPGNDIKLALYFTCTDLGTPGEDNTYGMGIIDVEAAFYYLIDQGHVPLAPAPALVDAAVLRLDAGVYQCEEWISGSSVVLGNTGQVAITSMEVQVGAGMGSEIVSWTGLLEPGDWIELPLPGLQAEPGVADLSVELLSVNGASDDRPLNNRFFRPLQVIDRQRPTAEADLASGMTICEGSVVALRAGTQNAGEAFFSWYEEATGAAALGEGPVFLAGPLSSDTVFYLGVRYAEKTGLEAREAGAWQAGGNPAQEGLVFDALIPFRLNTVKAYVETTGPRIVKLLDAEGQSLRTKPLVVNETGEVLLNLNMSIPAGQGLRLVLDAGIPLVYNSSGPAYPYVIEDVLAIRHATGSDSLERWYYFYDWEVEYEELCDRTPVPVMVSGQGQVLQPDFLVSADTLTLMNGSAAVSVTDLTVGATGWFWNFGDGTTSAEQNPVHSYSEPGIYAISLSASGADGCAGSAAAQVVVLPDPTSVAERMPAAALRLYPNPARDQVRLEWEGDASWVQITDLHGRSVLTRQVSGSWVELSLEGLSGGMYFVTLHTPRGLVAGKLQILR
jgi:subtilisin family serine protease